MLGRNLTRCFSTTHCLLRPATKEIDLKNLQNVWESPDASLPKADLLNLVELYANPRKYRFYTPKETLASFLDYLNSSRRYEDLITIFRAQHENYEDSLGEKAIAQFLASAEHAPGMLIDVFDGYNELRRKGAFASLAAIEPIEAQAVATKNAEILAYIDRIKASHQL